MASRAALQDPIGPAALLSGQAVTRPVAAKPLDPLVLALSQAAKRFEPARPRGQDTDAAD